MIWAVFSVVLSQSSYEIVVEVLQGKNLIFDILLPGHLTLNKNCGIPITYNETCCS